MKYDTNLGYLFDNDIKESNVFLIEDNGIKHEKIKIADAIKIADDKKMNVVLIVPSKDGKIGIARIVNKGKFLFDAKKKEKEKIRAIKTVKIKEITVRPVIGDNDLLRYANNTKEWFKDGCQVKFKVKASGKLTGRVDLVNAVYEKYLGYIGDTAIIQQPLKKLTPFVYSAFLVPNSKK
ncbi:MAG: hypothetical protein Ta2E_07260 [Mycoplasmoidaceae bacterium]|nr:MAG: hypothetical protein Ta2E_07260 [Mycoplasmoidaceae bacterium]